MTDLTNAPARGDAPAPAPAPDPASAPVPASALDAPLLERLAAAAEIALPEGALDAIAAWAEALVAWNARFNLTRITDPAAIAVQHALDALHGLRAVDDLDPRHPWRAVDVGSGNGCPGLILAAARPGWAWTLVESQGKAATFLRHAAGEMGLRNVRVVAARAEDAGRDPELRERFHVATARGVAPLPTLLEYALPLVRVEGRFVAWKGAAADEEVAASAAALGLLGGKVRRRLSYTLPGLDHPRRLVVVAKARRTPRHFPRRSGLPKHQPI